MSDVAQERIENDVPNIMQLIIDGAPEVRKMYNDAFNMDINHFISLAYRSFKIQETTKDYLPQEERAAWVDGFLFQALNTVIVSFHLFISGFTVPSDHLMRQFCESISTALLFSQSDINDYDIFLKNKDIYSFHKSIDRVNKKENKSILNIDKKAWKVFMDVASYYNSASHANTITMAMGRTLSGSGLFIGAGFDIEKKPYYEKGVKLRQDALGIHYKTVDHINSCYKG
jgi:hypothetical protein